MLAHVPLGPPDAQTWHLRYALAMGIPGPDTYAPVYIQRWCAVCRAWEEQYGEHSTVLQQMRLGQEP